jgi:phenylacetaldehyde dehydrogenase
LKPAVRSRILHRIADMIEQNAEELAYLESLDNGKPISQSLPIDISATAGAFRYYAGWADKIHGSTYNISMPGDYHSYTLREPVGVVGLIVPWNYPLVMAAVKLGPALAAGCTCILKPAEETPLTALRLGELMAEAGVPEGVVNILPGIGEVTGAALVAHPGVDKVAFTGSTEVGKAIVQAATGNLKKVSLELGGKAPNIIFPDADLSKAIPGSAMGIFFNSGQVCTATSRLYVHEDIYDEVVSGVSDFAKILKIGPGLEPESQLGPLVSERQLDRVMNYVAKGKEEGGTIATGGSRFGEQGYFIEPTVIADTTNEMVVTREEIFGPVLVAQKFKDLEEVTALANDSTYGLSAALWTKNISTAHKLARRLRAGLVSVNTQMAADFDLPIGGYKQSGWGRENGLEGLSLYLETKSVVVALDE